MHMFFAFTIAQRLCKRLDLEMSHARGPNKSNMQALPTEAHDMAHCQLGDGKAFQLSAAAPLRCTTCLHAATNLLAQALAYDDG